MLAESGGDEYTTIALTKIASSLVDNAKEDGSIDNANDANVEASKIKQEQENAGETVTLKNESRNNLFCPTWGSTQKTSFDNDNHEERWKRRWTGFLNSFKANIIGAEENDSNDVAFSLLLQLYAHKPVIAELNRMYERDPKYFMFYLPQLCNVLLHGRLNRTLSDPLEKLLLDKSERSVSIPDPDSDKKVDHSGFIEAVQSCGEKAAQLVKPAVAVNGSQPQRVPPVVMIQNNSDKYELLLLPRLHRGPPYIIGTSKFNWALSFCDELTHFAAVLKDINPNDRNLTLRSTLESLEGDFFPSDVLYLPLGRNNSKVVGIVAEESFCFATNERVPYMLCLEVIDEVPEKYGINEQGGKETFGDSLLYTIGSQMEEWGQKIASTVSTTPVRPNTKEFVRLEATTTGREKQNQHRSRTVSDNSPIQRSCSNKTHDFESGTEVKLGQWKPKINKPRGQGFSHYDFVEQMTPEMRQRLIQRIDSDSNELILQSPDSRRRSASVSTRLHDHVSGPINFNIEQATTENEATTPLTETVQKNINEKKNEYIDTNNENNTDKDGINPSREKGHGNNQVGIGDHSSEPEEKPSLVVFREKWREKEHRIRQSRPWGPEPGWRLVPVIVKANDDLRQEQFALQLISQFDRIFRDANLSLWLHPYKILATSPTAGLIEAVPDTISLDSLKKNDPNFISLKDFFSRFFGEEVQNARRRFCDSLAAYCIVSYLLQIKDRHNGNLLLHAKGFIIHIDFGFILSNSPGNMNFESSPFKLTNEFVQLIGGPDSPLFSRFRKLCCQGFLAARKRREEIVLLVEMMRAGNEHLPCFKAGGEATVRALNERFQPQLSKTGCVEFVNDLIDTSIDHWRTRWYDRYQRCMVGIAY